MEKLKGLFNFILSSMMFAFMTYKMNFNSTVISRQFSTVSLFFLIKNVLVSRRTSYVKGLHILYKFLPVPDNQA